MKSIAQIIKLIDWLSQHIIRVIIILFITILVIQSLLQYEAIRTFIVPTERWEGIAAYLTAFATHYRL